MCELLPETWRLDSEAQGSCCQTKRPRRGMITDFQVWSECYATMGGILSTRYPDKASHLFAYLKTISRASRTFESLAWASYDMAFRRQAANRGSLNWGVVDPALYNEAFTGRARAIARCSYCLSDTHAAHECPYAPQEVKPVEAKSWAEARTGRPSQRQSVQGQAGPRAPTVEICRLFNNPAGNHCRFPLCRYAHLCVRCRSPHPLSECADRRRNSTRGHSSPPPTKV